MLHASGEGLVRAGDVFEQANLAAAGFDTAAHTADLVFQLVLPLLHLVAFGADSLDLFFGLRTGLRCRSEVGFYGLLLFVKPGDAGFRLLLLPFDAQHILFEVFKARFKADLPALDLVDRLAQGFIVPVGRFELCPHGIHPGEHLFVGLFLYTELLIGGIQLGLKPVQVFAAPVDAFFELTDLDLRLADVGFVLPDHALLVGDLFGRDADGGLRFADIVKEIVDLLFGRGKILLTLAEGFLGQAQGLILLLQVAAELFFLLFGRNDLPYERLQFTFQVQVFVAANPHVEFPEVLLVAFGALGLVSLQLQGPGLFPDFDQDILNAEHIGACIVELAVRLFALLLVPGNPGGLLEQPSPVVVLVVQDLLDHLQLDHRIGTRAHAGIHEQLDDVFQAALRPVDQVFALARAVEPPRNGHIVVLDGQNFTVVFDGDGDLGHAKGFFRGCAVEDHIGHRVGPELRRTLLTEHPAQCVDDIRFPAAVGADDYRDAAVEFDGGFIGKAFKTMQLEFC